MIRKLVESYCKYYFVILNDYKNLSFKIPKQAENQWYECGL